MTDTKTASDQTTIVIRYEPNNTLRRFPCTICGGATDKQDPMAEFQINGRSRFACDGCATGPMELIRVRLADHASELEAEARSLRDLIHAYWTPAAEEDRNRCSGCGQICTVVDEADAGPTIGCRNTDCEYDK